MTRSALIKSSLLALALIASGPAAAQDSAGARAAILAANSVGHWIASQGNQALIEIRKDLRENLTKSLKPLLSKPAEAAATAAAPATTTASAR